MFLFYLSETDIKFKSINLRMHKSEETKCDICTLKQTFCDFLCVSKRKKKYEPISTRERISCIFKIDYF